MRDYFNENTERSFKFARKKKICKITQLQIHCVWAFTIDNVIFPNNNENQQFNRGCVPGAMKIAVIYKIEELPRIYFFIFIWFFI